MVWEVRWTGMALGVWREKGRNLKATCFPSQATHHPFLKYQHHIVFSETFFFSRNVYIQVLTFDTIALTFVKQKSSIPSLTLLIAEKKEELTYSNRLHYCRSTLLKTHAQTCSFLDICFTDRTSRLLFFSFCRQN